MLDRLPANPGRVLITPEDGSPAYYAVLTRADNPTQDGTPLNKASLLKDETAAKFGLGNSAVPDDVLGVLSRFHAGLGNEHVWEKVKMTTTVTPSFTGSSVYVSLIAMTPDANATGSLTYAETIDISRNLVNPKTVSFSFSNYEHLSSVLANAYFIHPSDSSQLLYCDGTPKIHYYSEEVEEVVDEDEDGNPEDIYYVTHYALSIQSGGVVKRVSSVTVSGGISEHHGYVSSPDPNAYPIDDGFTYMPRGQVGSLARIVTGSYVGNGKYGAANKNSLTFDFQPKLLLITVGHFDQFQKGAMFMYGQSESTVINNGGSYSSSMGHISLSWFGNGVAWWDGYHNGDGAAAWQLNANGLTYYYTAIG